MKSKFVKLIIYGHLVIFAIISISSLGYYLDSLNPTVIQVCRDNCNDDISLTEQEAQDNLQNVLDNCDCQESNQTPCITPRLAYQNDTHSIDNIDCSWKIHRIFDEDSVHTIHLDMKKISLLIMN